MTMREITSLAPSEIHIGDRLRRSLNRDTVDRLKQSIEKIGLKTPISVQYVSDEEGFLLVAGHHRLQACVELGWTDIPVREEGGSDLDARMWEIAENLHRADLTALEHDEHVAEWIRLSDEKIKAHIAPLDKPHDRGRPNQGINAAVRDLGIERTQAQRAIRADTFLMAANLATMLQVVLSN
jgi:ParB family chromosome partitioning protein